MSSTMDFFFQLTKLFKIINWRLHRDKFKISKASIVKFKEKNFLNPDYSSILIEQNEKIYTFYKYAVHIKFYFVLYETKNKQTNKQIDG